MRNVVRVSMMGWLASAVLITGGIATAQDQPAPKVSIAAARTIEITDEAAFIGRGEAIDKVDLVARVSGFVEEVIAENGSVVKEGDPLFRIQSDSYVAAVSSAEATLEQAKAELTLAGIELGRKQELYDRGTSPESELDIARANELVAEAQVTAARAALKQANLDLSYTVINAPFDGRLSRAMVSVGELVTPQSGALVSLVRTAPIYVNFALTEKTLLSITSNARAEKLDYEDFSNSPPVSVRLPDGSMLDEIGDIVFVDNRINPATGTISIRAQFDNANRLIFDGSFVHVVVRAPQSRQALAIPQSAVQRDQRGDFVLVVNAQQMVEQRYVTLGVTEGVEVVVQDGLTEGETVIVEGLQRVRPGAAVDAVLTGTEAE